jgi:hypothetical protein
MAKSSKTKNTGLLIRNLFQELLKEHVKTKEDRLNLAKILGVSESAVKGMIYTGNGGLDNWVNAFAHYYKINEGTIKNLKMALKKDHPLNESDKIWFDIKAPESRKLKFAMIARAVHQIEEDLK